MSKKKKQKATVIDLPYSFICGECAKSKGATWPKGHVATCHSGTCLYCNMKKSLCNIGDWDWKDGIRRGMRD